MSRSIKIILRADIRGLGRAGDIKMVRRGFARNFLLPQRLALEATPATLRVWEQEREKVLSLAEQTREGARGTGEKLAALSCKFVVKAGPEGKLFGSITNLDILKNINAQGFKVERRMVELPLPIKTVGTHEARVHLHPEVTVKVAVVVEAEEVK